MSGPTVNDWSSMCERWRAIGLEHYKPLSKSKCDEIIQDSLQAIKTHKLPEGMKDTSAVGWRDWVHLDADEHYVCFTIRNPMWSADLEQVVDHKWSLYTDGDLYKQAHLGQNCELFHHTLQQISPDIMIVQRVAKYQSLEQLTHSLAITFRVKTETGHMIVTRCIESPQLDSLMKAEGLSLCGSFYWDTFDVTHRDARGECDAIGFAMAGSIGSDNSTYAKRWRDELLIALKRYESQLKDTSIVSKLDTSGIQDTAVASQATA